MSTSSRLKKILAAGLLIIMPVVLIFGVTVAGATDNCFTDVSTGDWFHDFVCWMFDAGLTSGYPDGSFRPNNNITRAEVSVFMQQIAGAGTAGRVVDADKLDGLDAPDLRPVVSAALGSISHGTNLGSLSAGSPFEAASATITAPADGTLLAFGSSGWELGTPWLVQWLEIDQGTPCDNFNSTDKLPGSGTEETPSGLGASLNSQAVVNVTSGNHTASLCYWIFSGGPSTNISHSLIVQWLNPTSVSIAAAEASSAPESVTRGPSAP